MISRRTFLMTPLLLIAAWGRPAGTTANTDLASLTINKAAELMRSRAVSPLEFTQACLKRIEKYNSPLNAFITVTAEEALATATSPEPPVTVEEVRTRAVGRRNTLPFDIFGIPTIDVPCGFTNSGLPVGLQISAPPFAETPVLALAHAYEQATEWHRRLPLPDHAAQVRP
jgi:Asp-tRNA(Asn)/Glu-tRNA(Gln) amidotransferase A subunit family amidase